MADIPRRLPPSEAERLRIVATRMAGGGDLGSTRWAQPIASTGNYSPLTLPADEPPAFDVGIYTSGAFVSSTIVANDTGDLERDVNYDYVIGVIGGDPGDGSGNVLSRGRAYLVEGLVTVSCDVGELPVNDADGVQFFARLDLDNTEVSCTVNATSSVTGHLTAGWSDSPADTSTRPTFYAPGTTGSGNAGWNAHDPRLIRNTLRLTAAPEIGSGYTGEPSISLVVRSMGPTPKLIHGAAFLRVSYLYDVVSPV